MKKVLILIRNNSGISIMAIIAMIFTISAIKSPRLCISVTEEETVFNASPYTFFNYDNDKPEHEAIEKVLFSMDTYTMQASVISIEVRNNGKASIGKSSYDINNPITITFENAELACKPYLWSKTCTIPIAQLVIQYPNSIILPSIILNHNDSYTIKAMLITTSHTHPKISISGQIANQERIKLQIDKDVHFFDGKKANPLLMPEAEYLQKQNWAECTMALPH